MLAPGLSTGLPMPVSEIAFRAIEGAEEIPPAVTRHQEQPPSLLAGGNVPRLPCEEVCPTRPLTQGTLVVHLRAPIELANARGIATAIWRPANEFNGEHIAFDENAETAVAFSAPVDTAMKVDVRIFVNQAQWEAVWLVRPEATL